LALDDPVKTLKVLKAANPVFKKIRFMQRSDRLYTQIAHVLGTFAPALTASLSKTCESIKATGLTAP